MRLPTRGDRIRGYLAWEMNVGWEDVWNLGRRGISLDFSRVFRLRDTQLARSTGDWAFACSIFGC